MKTLKYFAAIWASILALPAILAFFITLISIGESGFLISLIVLSVVSLIGTWHIASILAQE